MDYLKATDDELLATSPKYAGATPGSWRNDMRPEDEDQTDVNVGVPELYSDADRWGMWTPVTEMPFDGEALDAANLNLVTDAKVNAARVMRLEALVAELIDNFGPMLREIEARGYRNDFAPQYATLARAAELRGA
ncbi:MAG: hypothetical protein IKE42_28540 [Aquamicrobium sp.]|nr:hypothetical protein [Aquamicrobium sp.]